MLFRKEHDAVPLIGENALCNHNYRRMCERRMNKDFSTFAHRYFIPMVGITVLVGLYFTSRYNYLLFHSLAEIFSIVVAYGIFMIAWNSRKYIENGYLIFIAIAYLFIGGLDLLHTLSYKGMTIFPDYDYYANQLWIAARYMESLALLTAFSYFYRKTSK